METTLRAIRVRSYDGSDEAEMPVLENSTVEQAIPSWLDRLQLFSRDSEGNPVDWTLQDSHGNMIPQGVELRSLDAKESYTLAPDLTPA